MNNPAPALPNHAPRVFSKMVVDRFPPLPEQTLHHRHIFIVPSLYLIILGIVIGILWIMSVQFLLNLGYLLVFMLAGILVMAMMHTFQNLNGLTIALSDCPPIFLGESAACLFRLSNTSHHPKQMIDLRLNEVINTAEIVSDSEPTLITLPFQPNQRGWQPIPRIQLRTVYPLGFFVVWSYFQPSKRVLVFPRPIFSPLPLSKDDSGEDHGLHEVSGREDVIGVREYTAGDPLNLISWKHLMAHGKWVSKLTVQATGGKTLQFDWQQTTETDVEGKISQLCGWILQAHQNGDAFGLKLPHKTLAVDLGHAHLRRCLESLATF